MTQELKNQWLQALRSGQYKQGTDYLKHDDKDGSPCFCCLGVLCDILNPNDWKVDKDDKTVVYGWQYTNSMDVPKIVKTLIPRPITEQLINMNDGINSYAKNNFRQIADFIEVSIEVN